MDRPAHDPTLGEDCICFRCHLAAVSFSPAAMPSRYNAIPPKPPGNSYEKAVPTSSRGVPYLDSKGEPMTQKEWDRKGGGFLRELGAERANSNLVKTGAS